LNLEVEGMELVASGGGRSSVS